ncbi:PREDICTED: uncharacterized protein LOC109589734 [Amphimedon queenslandica]|nr:PREDICTED: uncharacterized protein LOC109589734 [Amphimedon queenslandica]|eukprot:XP_019861326.1 PREDICTED: uncharacterized protein LOC109589734 [Amphimedon queenslandica]
MLSWSFADDTTSNKRSDFAFYKDSNGQICYRPAPLGNGGQYFYIEHSLKKFGYKGKSNGQGEVEITDWKKESKGSSITPYALVDVETGTAYGIKVLIVTPTSKTTSYFLCPRPPSPGSNILTVKDSKIGIKGDVNVSWKVYRCSKSDQIYIYPVNGKSHVSSSLSNKNKSLEGEGKLKGPDKPGEYEVRYYPAWLKGSSTGHRHDIYIASVRFTVAV